MFTAHLDALMSPVADCLDRRSLKALVDLRASPAAARRMSQLAESANQGTLSPNDRSEYESCVLFASFLGVLQAKARKKLRASR